ncbi:unnamed protein product [Rhizoctonia solani]|uniref:BTB domain-containing protein n=1 Tax=Rhizoctonia solani TaxID=456999 RepID=A0A8H3I0Y6_9AGAM|nr:unnamed protein product [Rhizoctonia solani]
MPKRQITSATEPRTSKRKKSGKSANVKTTTPDNQPTYSMDPDYYFEDGSVILLVQDVLFKVHASLLKAQSQVFQDMFTMPAGDATIRIEGSSNQYPIVIPQVEPSQFRKLMQMIYSPASSAFHSSLYPTSNDDSSLETKAWSAFTFYLDVATLCHRFGMVEMENWTKKKLQTLILSSKWALASSAKSNPRLLLSAIEYARMTQDNELIAHIQQFTYYYICAPGLDLEYEDLMTLFRTPGLRENHPSVLGCIFSVFLGGHHTDWEDELFTRFDRMALFAGQVRLSPVPKSLKKGIRVPLFEKPPSLERFRKMVKLTMCDSSPPCSHGCDQTIMNIWLDAFDDDYYEDDIEGSSLSLLPSCRAEFLEYTQDMQCCRGCSSEFINQLNEDIELVYVRLGEYYREIE